MKFFIASKNKHKIQEFKRILLPLGFDVISENELDSPLSEVEETGSTFKENAILKATSAMQVTGLPAIADDSGLCVDYLNGEPGIYSARFAGEPVDNDKNNQKLLHLLNGVSKEKRTAKFVCCIACVFPNGKKLLVSGECKGYISDHLQGNNGFGYDPLFVSEIGSFGELSEEQKDTVSHRGKALREFSKKIKNLYSEELYA